MGLENLGGFGELQQPFLQENTFQQDPLYFYPYYNEDPALQSGFNKEMCNKTGMDFIVQIMPDACTPSPVRSDLLEEQGVPVFCKLTGIKIKNNVTATDTCSIDVILIRPKNKPYTIIHPFHRFLENHPNLFPILRQLLNL